MANKLNVSAFTSITPFAKQWISDKAFLEQIANNPGLFNEHYIIINFKNLEWVKNTSFDHCYNGTLRVLPAEYQIGGAAHIYETAHCSAYDQYLSTIVGTENSGFAISGLGGYVYVRDINIADSLEAWQAYVAANDIYLCYSVYDENYNYLRVNLNSLTWEKLGTDNDFYFRSIEILPAIGGASTPANAYCTNQDWNVAGTDNLPNNSIGIGSVSKKVFIKDTDFSTTAELTAYIAANNIYLYFEVDTTNYETVRLADLTWYEQNGRMRAYKADLFVPDTSAMPDGFCTDKTFIPKSWDTNFDQVDNVYTFGWAYVDDHLVNITFKSARFTTTAEFKAYLEANNVYLYYKKNS